MTKPIAGAQLRAFVERIERLHSERDSIADDIKDIYAEVRGNGYDTAALKEVLKRRKDPAKAKERDDIVAVYEAALGDGMTLANKERAPARGIAA